MSLAALQRDFCGWLTDGRPDVSRWLGTETHPGLAVYHNAYRVQLVDCLRETFEKTALWLGDTGFIAAARTHIERTPPHGWTLGIYGDGFDRTLAELHPEDPEIAELGWLDWTLSRAFEGPVAEAIAPEALAGLDWDNALLTLVPTMRMGIATTNAGAIWSALSAGEAPPAAAMLPTPGAMLVWRQGMTPCFRTIEDIERHALELIGAGASFGALCASLIDICGEGAGVEQAGTLLGQWIGDGLIAVITDKREMS